MSGCSCIAEFDKSSGGTFDNNPDSFIRGDTVDWTVNFQTELCEPIDITGWKLYLVLRDRLPQALTSSAYDCNEFGAHVSAEPTIFVFETLQNDTTLTVAGVGKILIPSTETALVPAGSYYYEFKRLIVGTNPPDIFTFVPLDGPSFTVYNATVLDVV